MRAKAVSAMTLPSRLMQGCIAIFVFCLDVCPLVDESDRGFGLEPSLKMPNGGNVLPLLLFA